LNETLKPNKAVLFLVPTIDLNVDSQRPLQEIKEESTPNSTSPQSSMQKKLGAVGTEKAQLKEEALSKNPS
jgi:hypothetical protein